MSMLEELAHDRRREYLRTAEQERLVSHLAAARRWRRIERLAHRARLRHEARVSGR